MEVKIIARINCKGYQEAIKRNLARAIRKEGVRLVWEAQMKMVSSPFVLEKNTKASVSYFCKALAARKSKTKVFAGLIAGERCTLCGDAERCCDLTWLKAEWEESKWNVNPLLSWSSHSQGLSPLHTISSKISHLLIRLHWQCEFGGSTFKPYEFSWSTSPYKKYIHSIPVALIVLTHPSINWNVQIWSPFDHFSQICE